jgi:hypothetical protein
MDTNEIPLRRPVSGGAQPVRYVARRAQTYVIVGAAFAAILAAAVLDAAGAREELVLGISATLFVAVAVLASARTGVLGATRDATGSEQRGRSSPDLAASTMLGSDTEREIARHTGARI